MKNVQLFKKNFFKPLANKQFLLDRASFNSVKYYAFTLPRRYCYKMYRFLRNFKRLVFFKKQFYIKFTAFNKKKIDNYQLNINFFNKLNFFFINFFFD
jgi:hypothetical protein